MSYEASLSTRLDALCPGCKVPYKLREPTDALAERPVTVEAACPVCGEAARFQWLTSGKCRRIVNRSPGSGSTASGGLAAGTSRQGCSPSGAGSVEPAESLFASRRAAPTQRPSEGSVSGVNLTSRYSLSAEELTQVPSGGQRRK